MKHNLLTSLAAAAMIFGASVQASADPDLSSYTLVATLNFNTGENTEITLSDNVAGTAYMGSTQSVYQVEEPEEYAPYLALYGVGNGSGSGWWIRGAYGGLWAYGGARCGAITGRSQGDVIVFTCNQAASNVLTFTNASGEPDGNYTTQTSDDGYSVYATMTDDGIVGFAGIKNSGYISSITIYSAPEGATYADYTVKYVCDDTEIQDATPGNGIVGSTVSVSTDDLYIGDKKYIYSGNDAATNTIAEDGNTVVTITYTEAATYSYSVVASIDETTKTIAEDSDFEGETITVSYDKYILEGTTLYYAANETTTNTNYYQYSFTLSEDNQTVTIDYTSSIENVVYYSEAEDITGMTASSSGSIAARCSGAAGAYAATDVTITNLPAGTYKIAAMTWANNSTATTFTITAGSNSLTVTTSRAQLISGESEEFTLDESTDVVVSAEGGANFVLDYIYITGTVASGDSGETTAIEALEAEREADDTIYDLSGRKVVGEPAPGLYIKGGKKYLVR